MRKVEIFFALLTILTIVLMVLNIPGGILFTSLSIMIWSGLYFFGGLLMLNGIPLSKMFTKESYQGISALRIIGSVLLGIVLSMALNSILFMLMQWSGAHLMVYTGAALLIVALIISLVKWIQSKSSFHRANTWRTLILLLVIAFLLSYSFVYTVSETTI